MQRETRTAPQPHDSRRNQIAFMAVGLAIIAAGLWWLYEIERPYHPFLEGNDVHLQQVADS